MIAVSTGPTIGRTARRVRSSTSRLMRPSRFASRSSRRPRRNWRRSGPPCRSPRTISWATWPPVTPVQVSLRIATDGSTTGTRVPSAVRAASRGTCTVTAVSGVATFANLSIDQEGIDYDLEAFDLAVGNDFSRAFDITATTASRLGFTTQPANRAAGVGADRGGDRNGRRRYHADGLHGRSGAPDRGWRQLRQRVRHVDGERRGGSRHLQRRHQPGGGRHAGGHPGDREAQGSHEHRVHGHPGSGDAARVHHAADRQERDANQLGLAASRSTSSATPT